MSRDVFLKKKTNSQACVGMQIGLNTDEEQINKGGGKRKCLGNHHQTKINCNHKSIKIIMMQTTRPFFSLSFWFWVFP